MADRIASPGEVEFTVDLGTTNAVVPAGAAAGPAIRTIRVPVVILDDVFQASCPVVIKIDVEGLETGVIAGARRLLRDQRLLGILMELNGSGAKYGYDERKLVATLEGEGFSAFSYDPFRRQLTRVDLASHARRTDNVIFARHIDEELVQRLRTAPQFDVRGKGRLDGWIDDSCSPT